MKCEFEFQAPGPHEGGVEFAEPDVMTCSKPAEVVVRYESPFGPERFHVCRFHGNVMVEWPTGPHEKVTLRELSRG